MDYIDTDDESFGIELLVCVKEIKDLTDFIKRETSRDQILTFIDNHEFELITENSIDGLCKKIALSEYRTGAIIIDDQFRPPLFYKKIREIASAESARLILKLSHSKQSKNIIRIASPDYILFEFKENLWMGSFKKSLLK